MNEEQREKLAILKASNKEYGMCYSDRTMIEKSHDYYIVWDNAEVPIIKCKGECIFENWNDVIAVAFDTCFIDCETEKGFLIRE